MELKMSAIQQQIFNTAKELLEPIGFKGNKQKLLFKRKSASKIEQIDYAFNDYRPSYLEFYFGITITYPNLINRVKDFYKLVSSAREPSWNIFITEGFFLSDEINKTPKERSMSRNIIKSNQDVKSMINKSVSVIEKEVLPFIDLIETETKFQKFVESNPQFIFDHIMDIELFSSSLVATQLYNPNAIPALIDRIEVFLGEQKKNGLNYSRNFEYLNLFKSLFRDSC